MPSSIRDTIVPNGTYDTPNAANQAPIGRYVGFRDRLQSAAQEAGLNQATVAKRLGLTSGTFSRYWSGDRLPPADTLMDLADIVSAPAIWLIRGGERQSGQLVEADNADWIELPQYDLRKMDDHSKGPVEGSTVVRRDWLNRSFGRDRGLWLTPMPSEYGPLDLHEGDIVICCDIAKEDLRERHLCIWRSPILNLLLVARYSVIHRGSHMVVIEDGEYWANPWLIEGDAAEGKGADLIAVGRILGRPIAPIR